MEPWRTTWRSGFLPAFRGLLDPAALSAGLNALAVALYNDAPELVQGSTSVPPPLLSCEDMPTEGADAVAFVGWKAGRLARDAEGKTRVREVEKFFAESCALCNGQLPGDAACRAFLAWFDTTPRDLMRAELLAELRWNLAAAPDPLHPDGPGRLAALRPLPERAPPPF